MLTQDGDTLHQQRTSRDQDRWLAYHKQRIEKMYQRVLSNGHKREAEIFKHATEQLVEHDNAVPYEMLGWMNKTPVTIDEFMDSPEFLGDLMELWPALREDLRGMNPDVFVGAEAVHEVLMGGATGTGKTFTSQVTQMYQLYLFTCFNQVQRMFHLAVKTPIVFMLQSVSPTITKRVIYEPLRETFVSMPYTSKHVNYDMYNKGTLKIEGGLVVSPSAASLQAIVGQSIPSGVLDEVNFMQLIEESKKVAGPSGMGGRFDQAEVAYTNLSRRRKRSFLTKGYSLGVLCVLSSTRYNGDFLDRRIEEVKTFDEKNILTIRHKQYEVAPPERYSGETFTYMVTEGDIAGRVIEEGEVAGVNFPANARLEQVPIELRTDFLRDPEASQRDYMGIATDAISPFIKKRQKINDALFRGTERSIPPLLESDQVLLATDGMPTFLPENFPKIRQLKNKSRWVHVDLSRTKDKCGIAMVRLDGFQNAPMSDQDSASEVMPMFTVEFAVGIKPSQVAPIEVAVVRGWVMRLVREYELNIEGVSFDGFDSRETIQALRASNVWSDLISVDTTTKPYDGLRDALYEDRITFQPDLELLATELRTVEYYATKNKIDHPPRGTKDVADAVAGALEFAMRSRQVRNGISFIDTDYTDPNTTNRVTALRERVRIARKPPKRR
jgi:hypothetical protein